MAIFVCFEILHISSGMLTLSLTSLCVCIWVCAYVKFNKAENIRKII